MWGFESPLGHITKSKKKPSEIANFFIFNMKIQIGLNKIKKAKNSLFLAYVRIHKGEK